MRDDAAATTESGANAETVVPYTSTPGLLFAEHQVWTVIAASHDDGEGFEVVDVAEIAAKEEEWVGYFASKTAANALPAYVTDAWDSVTVVPCASARFGNCFVVRLRRATDDWFARREYDPSGGSTYRPCCECGECEGPGQLPLAAWEVAGAAGEGKGANGSDLLACAPGHVPDGFAVVEDHGDWIVCETAARSQ